MYVLNNTVRAENGEIVARFSKQDAALTAITRIMNPDYTPLYAELPSDLGEETAMNKRIADMVMSGKIV